MSEFARIIEVASPDAVKELVQAEVARVNAEAHKAEQEARTAETTADTLQIHLSREKLKWNEEQADNKYHNVYIFNSAVSEQSTRACMNRLTMWDRIQPQCDIEIVFSSPGGNVIDGMALFDFILALREKGHKVVTSTIGYAASMAGILLQAGDTRKMGREAYILIHEISFGIGGKIGEVEDEVAFVKKIQSRVLDIFAERSSLTKRQIDRRWKRKDWWLDSNEALALGFVDEVA